MPTKCLIGFKLFKQRRCGFTDPAWRRTSGWRSSTTQRFGSWAWTRARFTGRKALRRTAATTTRTAAITKCVLLCYLSSRFIFLFLLLLLLLDLWHRWCVRVDEGRLAETAERHARASRQYIVLVFCVRQEPPEDSLGLPFDLFSMLSLRWCTITWLFATRSWKSSARVASAKWSVP